MPKVKHHTVIKGVQYQKVDIYDVEMYHDFEELIEELIGNYTSKIDNTSLNRGF